MRDPLIRQEKACFFSSQMLKKSHAYQSVNKSTKQHPGVTYYSVLLVVTIAKPLQLVLLPEPAIRARDVQKTVQCPDHHVFPI